MRTMKTSFSKKIGIFYRLSSLFSARLLEFTPPFSEMGRLRLPITLNGFIPCNRHSDVSIYKGKNLAISGRTFSFGGIDILINEKHILTTVNNQIFENYVLSSPSRSFPVSFHFQLFQRFQLRWNSWSRLEREESNRISEQPFYLRCNRYFSQAPTSIENTQTVEQIQGSKIWTGKVTRKPFRKGLPAGSGRFSQGGEHKRKRVGMISITATGNNTLFTLSDGKGKLRGSVSAGSVGFRNSGKSALAAAEKGAARIIFKAQEAGFQLLRIEMRGIGYTKLKALRAMVHTPVPILEIVEKTARSHNGCRLPRKRRL